MYRGDNMSTPIQWYGVFAKACSGADPDFNKGGCLNEKGCTVAKPLSQLLCSCGGGLPNSMQSVEAGAIRIFCDTKIL